MPISQLASADEKCRTFVFEDEGHTLGNALRSVIVSYPEVEFCGYTVPHPAEKKVNLRIQLRKGRAVDVLRRALDDLAKMCDITLEKFDEDFEAFKAKTNIP